MTDEEYEAWTGWNKNQFDYMYEQISSFLRSSSNRTSRNAFAIFWIKMKTKDGGGYASKNGPIYKSIQNLH